MAFDFHLHLESGTPESRALEAVVEREHITPEEAVRAILRRAGEDGDIGSQPAIQMTHWAASTETVEAAQADTNDSVPGALLIGLMSAAEDAALMDEVVDMAMAARRKRWERILSA